MSYSRLTSQDTHPADTRQPMTAKHRVKSLPISFIFSECGVMALCGLVLSDGDSEKNTRGPGKSKPLVAVSPFSLSIEIVCRRKLQHLFLIVCAYRVDAITERQLRAD